MREIILLKFFKLKCAFALFRNSFDFYSFTVYNFLYAMVEEVFLHYTFASVLAVVPH